MCKSCVKKNVKERVSKVHIPSPDQIGQILTRREEGGPLSVERKALPILNRQASAEI